jgi:hypothetical protein
MFWGNENDSQSTQRLKNAEMTKAPLTNKERNDPTNGVIALVGVGMILVVVGLVILFSSH